MTTLTIKDVVLNDELDRDAMAAVRGGFFGGPFRSYWEEETVTDGILDSASDFDALLDSALDAVRLTPL